MKNGVADNNEMEELNSTRRTERSSWNSTSTSDNSYAQTTLHSTTNMINGKTNGNNTQELRNNANLNTPSFLSHRQSLNRRDEEDNNLSTTSTTSPATQTTSTPNINTHEEEASKPNIFGRFIAAWPMFAHMRKNIKASVALLIAIIFIFDEQTRAATGESVLLVAIVVIFYFPVRTIGIQTEAVVLGTMGGLLAAAWSFLGSYLASLARDQSNPNPVQPGACAVLAAFLFFGTFALNLIRMEIPKANFGTVIACIVLTFTMTYSASAAPFMPEITWLFLRPVALAGGVSLAVNYFLWPDDSINNFLGITRKILGGYNAFFKEHSDAFLSNFQADGSTTLQNLNARLSNDILLMIDCKRAVKREILYSRISDEDCSRISKSVTGLRTSLHGLGLSLIMKNNYLNSDTTNIYFKQFSDPRTIDAFTTTLQNIRPIANELTNLCFNATNETVLRLGGLHYHGRTDLNSILWPFPRLWVSKTKMTDAALQPSQPITSTELKQVIDRFAAIPNDEQVFYKFLKMNAGDIPRNGPLYLLFLYLHNLKEHANHIVSILELVELLEAERRYNKFWFPHQTLKKWLTSNAEVGAAVDSKTNEYSDHAGGNDLVRVSTRQDGRRELVQDDVHDVFDIKHPSKKTNTRLGDPDVSAPVTMSQKFFYGLYRFGQWLTSTNTFFAFKTSVGVVMLAIPAWRPQDAAWYIAWRGQWAMITLVLWMFPMTGAFLFGLIDRVAGSVLGAIAGIVVWEISQGNPYGLAVVCFVCFLPLYHIFFFIPKYRVVSLMTTITMILVISYEYGYVVEGSTSYDAVWTVAGKRLLLVVIGIAASGILISIPFPPTSRVELRKRVAYTIRDIGKAYGILSASALSLRGQKAHPTVVKAFQKLAIELRRQVSEERVLLHHAKFEPPLRGYFPSASYTTLVEKIDNMSDLVINMGAALREVRPEWRRNIASILMKERKDYLSSILSNLKLLSSTLSAKTALPPYMLSPVEARERFVILLEKKLMIQASDIANDSFPCYSAYLMNSLVFVDELHALLTVVEDLVGVEDPEEWLISRV